MQEPSTMSRPSLPMMRLRQLKDVSGVAPADQQALSWSSTDGRWVPTYVTPDTQTITVDQATDGMATANPATATVTQMMSWIVKAIAAIIGGDWFGTPPLTLTALAAHAGRHHFDGADPLQLGLLTGTLTQAQHGFFATEDTHNQHGVASATHNGLLAATDKVRLDGLLPADTTQPLTATVTGAPGAATQYSRSDHRHALPAPATLASYIGVPLAYSGTPAPVSTSGGASGAGTTYARSDHQHALPSAAALKSYIGYTEPFTASGSFQETTSDHTIHASSASSTIAGISYAFSSSGTYMVSATFEIDNTSASDYNYETKLSFYTESYTTQVKAGTKAIVTLTGVHTGSAHTCRIHIFGGGGASYVRAGHGTLSVIRVA